MSEKKSPLPAGEGQGEGGAPELQGGSYEVIRARLLAQAKALGEKAEALNTRRKELFGGAELTVIGNERVRTENNCVPRDIVSVGDRLLFGYNVFLGLKRETHLGDVFSLHHFEKNADGFDFSHAPTTDAGGFLADERFVRDFQELYKYYKDTRLTHLRRTESGLLAVFQIGASERDVKVFRFAIDPDGKGTYVDSRGEREYVPPNSHDFEWITATRDQFVTGRHPHVNVLDQVFVETIRGDLTVKVENNTEDGQGIYSEPVDDPNQSLEDAEIAYARVGALILLRVRPFREEKRRYLVFNTRTEHVVRIDAIGQACIQLPEDQGIIFPGGYYLQTGDFKIFEGAGADGLMFERVIRSPNGEDVLYVFYGRSEGHYLLFPYNLVRKEVQNPIPCHGFTVFADGRMIVFREQASEPTRVHPMQVWQTPFVSPEFAAAAPPVPGYLGKIGNAELVRGISDVLTLRRIASTSTPTRRTFEDLISGIVRAQDAFHWLAHGEVDFAATLSQLKTTSELIVDEFEKVLALQKRAQEALAEAEKKQSELIASLQPEELQSIDGFMRALGNLRQQRGQLITLKDVRYVDLVRIAALERQVAEENDRVSHTCVEFLQGEQALRPVAETLSTLLSRIEPVKTTLELQPMVEALEETSKGLDVLGEVVSGLQVGDPVARARILENISELYARANRVRATLQGKRKDLLGKEKRAEFGAQFKLLGQAIESSLANVDSPEKCDEQLGKLVVQLEELEGRFGEFDEFLGELQTRREEVYEAFGARKQALLDERQRRAQNLFGAADRILSGVQRRARSFADEDALNAYFASDAMVLKLRQIAEQLAALGDSVRADELESKVKTARQDGLRALRDKRDLFEGGDNLIKFGRHRFSVNTQPLELTVIPREGELSVTLTGTDFAQPITDPKILEHKSLFEQHLVSESADVSRAEYLAASILFEAEEGKGTLTVAALHAASREAEGLLGLVRSRAAERYEEGYERGIHDSDAAAILEKLLTLYEGAGLLRYASAPRALACLFWAHVEDARWRDLMLRRAVSLGRLREAFGIGTELIALGEELAQRIGAWLKSAGIPHVDSDVFVAGRYLADQLSVAQGGPRFVTRADAAELVERLWKSLQRSGTRSALEDDLHALEKEPAERLALARAWLVRLIESDLEAQSARPVLDEATVLLATERRLERDLSTALTSTQVTGLLSQHPRISERSLTIALDEFLSRLGEFRRSRVPAYVSYRRALRDTLERERKKLRVEELFPKVLSSFVRNRLIDEVYLPIIGDNLAKQLGASGEGKRTDRMGLLLLVSPPGYGKTTLMEYVASRLGLAFVKVNGPALGHNVTSIDPAEAPNATARQEVERINFALEMGNNVMLYLDDIQHTNSELLQKFISLCDGQRRIEGVWNGVTRTYDLRGKKFCVVMAGNPYTETGERFQIPDMLANRADTYNLGEILEGKGDVFSLSYLENSITSNPVLAPLASRDPKDLFLLIRMAQGEAVAASELTHPDSPVEINERVNVLKHLLAVQRTLGKVNAQYITSAAQDDRYRTEPPFKLQGSYRNMNKLSEKVVPAMTAEELEQLIDSHYQGEAQTLTTSAEQNLLKLAELRSRLTKDQQKRWMEIKRGFTRVLNQGGKDEDPVTRVTAQLSGIGAHLQAIKDAVESAVSGESEETTTSAAQVLVPRLEDLGKAVREVASVASEVAARPAADLGPTLEKLAETMKQVRAPSGDLAPVLEKLTEVMGQVRSPELGPVLEKLAEAMSQVRAPELGPVLERLAEAITQTRVSSAEPGSNEKAAGATHPARASSAEPARSLENQVETMPEVGDQRSAPGPTAEKAGKALKHAASAQRPEPIALDLRPYLDRLNEVLRTLAAREPAGEGAQSRKRYAASTTPLPAELSKQLELLQLTLQPIAVAARRNLQSGEGTIKAMQVWQGVSEAMELLKAISGEASR